MVQCRRWTPDLEVSSSSPGLWVAALICLPTIFNSLGVMDSVSSLFGEMESRSPVCAHVIEP